MIRQSTELLDGSTSKQKKSVNGHSIAISDDEFEPEMDIDEQTNSADDWDEMDTEEADSGLKYQGLLDMTLTYGRELKYEFRNDRSKHVENAFRDIFSMFAYEDPRKSPTAHLLDQAGRVPVAEELNSAILGRRLFPPSERGIWVAKNPSSLVRQILLRRHRTSLPANRSPRQRHQRRRWRRGVH